MVRVALFDPGDLGEASFLHGFYKRFTRPGAGDESVYDALDAGVLLDDLLVFYFGFLLNSLDFKVNLLGYYVMIRVLEG